MPISLKSTLGSARPLGSTAWFPSVTPTLLTTNERVYLRTGAVMVDEQANYPDAFAAYGRVNSQLQTFMQRTLPASTTWQGVAYGAGLFVATTAASTNTYATSPDGVTWTLRSLPATANVSNVRYLNGLFIAVCPNVSFLFTSPDGITWTQRTMPNSPAWSDVAYGNGMFVVVSNGNSIAASSPDGITWTVRALPASTTWISVVFGNGVFVATAANQQMSSSVDGITWTTRVHPINKVWYAITFYNGLFYMCDANTASVTYTSSPDGITWTTRTSLPFAGTWINIVAGDGMLMLISNANAYMLTSGDGITWTQRALPVSVQWRGATWGNGKTVLLSQNTSIAASAVKYTDTSIGQTTQEADASGQIIKYMRIK